jgi:hypothetical protein
MSNAESDDRQETHVSQGGMGVVFETKLPVRWSSLHRVLTSMELAEVNQRVESVLHTVGNLDDQHMPLPEDVSPFGPELARLDFKLNLLLDLVGDLASRGLERPPLRWVQIGARSVVWEDSLENAPEEVNSWGKLELWLHPFYPRALSLPARVTSVENEGGSARITTELSGLGESAQEQLERWIFSHHRRAVAHERPGNV